MKIISKEPFLKHQLAYDISILLIDFPERALKKIVGPQRI